MLRHAERIHDDSRFVIFNPDGSRTFGILSLHARDVFHHLKRIAAVEFLEARHDRIRSEEILGFLRFAIGTESIAPSLRIRIGLLLGIVAREQAVVEFEVIAEQAGTVGVLQDVLLVEFAGLEHFMDDIAHEDDIRSRTYLEELIGHLRRTRETRIDMDDFRTVLLAGRHDILETHRMTLGQVRPLNPDEVRILDIRPGIRHGATAKGCAQSRRRIGMADTGLVVDVDNAQCTGHLDILIAFLVIDLGTADEGKAIGTADLIGLAIDFFRLLPALLTRILHGMSGLVDSLFPADFLPVIASRCTVQRLLRTLLRVRNMGVAQSLAAESTTVDWTVNGTFELDELIILHVADDATTTSTEVANRGKLACPFELEFFRGSLDLRHVESQAGHSKANTAETCGFQEVTPAQIHQNFLL